MVSLDSYVNTKADGSSKIAANDRKLHTSGVSLLTKENTKLLHKINSGFKRVAYWNECSSNVTTEDQTLYLVFLINPRFQIVTKLWILSFDRNETSVHTGYYLQKSETKTLNILINDKTYFETTVKNIEVTYDTLRKIPTCLWDDYICASLFYYLYFQENYKVLVKHLYKKSFRCYLKNYTTNKFHYKS